MMNVAQLANIYNFMYYISIEVKILDPGDEDDTNTATPCHSSSANIVGLCSPLRLVAASRYSHSIVILILNSV